MGFNREKPVLDKYGIKIGGKYETLLCGSLFYFRLPREHWKARVEALKATGYNCVDVYVPWNFHEVAPGKYDFTGERDLGYFLGLLRDAGLYTIIRPGPYICSEWTGGAIPARILESGKPIRCADKEFIAETERWYRAALKEIAPYEFVNGGTVILLQLDNELDFFDCPDPNAYIAELKRIADSCGVGIPCFCCAGQYSVEKSGATTPGVEKTINCYPSSTDATFDAELRGYAGIFAKEGKPLMVSETNRDHFILRRELSCGSKLLGAYNQVSGTNFDFYQAVNNWGSPLAFLSTDYDFWSMIDNAGYYSTEAPKSVLFSAMLKTLGERIAKSLPDENTVVPEHSDFKTTEGGLSVLKLFGGGAAVCVPNFTDKEGEIEFSYNGSTVKTTVAPERAPFILFDVDLSGYGIPGRIISSDAELIDAKPDKLVFVAYGDSTVTLELGGVHNVKSTCKIGGVEIELLPFDDAVDYIAGKGKVRAHKYKGVGEFDLYASSDLPEYAPVTAKQPYFSALGINYGKARYEVDIPAGKKLYIEHPCDIMSYTADGVTHETLPADGRDVLLPESASGKYVVDVEKWGHSNFDDSQAPCLRLSCKKGVTYFGCVESETKLARGNFALYDSYPMPVVETEFGYPVRLTVNAWNSTRKPVICAYTHPVRRTTDRLIVKVTEAIDVAVYIDGKLLGECDYGTFDLTAATEKNKQHALTLLYRKRFWTQDSGNAVILGVNDAPFKASVLSEKQLPAFKAEKGKKLALPLEFKVGEKRAFVVDTSKIDTEGHIVFKGNNLLLTCTRAGRVIGRIAVDWEKGPSFAGGDSNKLYVSTTYRGEPISVYAEALGEGAVLTGAEYII